MPAGWAVLAADARMWGGAGARGAGGAHRHPLAVAVPGRRARAGRIPGAPDLPAIVAAAAALRAVLADAAPRRPGSARLIDRIRARGRRAPSPDVEVLGDPVDRLPHLVTFSCLYVDGEALLTALDRHGFAVSSGSSCTVVDPRAVARPGRDGRADLRQRPGVAAPETTRGRGRRVPGRAAAACVADVRAELGAAGL